MKRVLVGLWFVLLSSVAWAAPSEQQVQDAVKAGQFTQAQSMMADVVAEHPDSAKAHYVYAELLAHNGAYNKASEEASKAQQLDPKIAFTDPAKFSAFQRELQRAQNRSTTTRPVTSNTPAVAPSYGSTAPSAGGGIPGWVWLVGLVVLAIVLWRGLMRSRMASGVASGPAAGYGQPGMNQGYGPGYSPYGPGGMPGAQPRSGALGTGLAVAGGVAGGMLLDEVLHHRDGGSGAGGGFIPDANAGAASDLQDRSIDFGNGNDWGSGGGGGGIDLGGGGDSGGGGGDWT